MRRKSHVQFFGGGGVARATPATRPPGGVRVGEARLYPSAPDFGKFDEMSRYYPGVTPDGRQVLVVQSSPLVCAHQFDPDGRYLGREFRTTDWSDALSWARELRLTPATIRVRAFSTFV